MFKNRQSYNYNLKFSLFLDVNSAFYIYIFLSLYICSDIPLFKASVQDFSLSFDCV